MEELGLSFLVHGPDVAGVFRPWLEHFGNEQRIHIETSVFEWEAAWPELVKVALFGHGPNVSEIGSTWVSTLIGMNSLLPFSANELGGTAAYVPLAWQNFLEAGQGKIWAIPWLAYTRLIYYRRDLLAKAGIDESSAFESPEKVEQTLGRLSENKVAVPWCVPTGRSRDTLHNIASWVWGAGGEFISADGKYILFDEPKARAGMHAYFDLHRHLAPAARHRNEADSLFTQGQAAAVMSGPWLWPLGPHHPDVAPEVVENVGVAVPLQTAFIGFSYLAIWKHTRREDLALKLIHELTKPNVLAAYSSRVGGPLSVHLETLANSPLAGEPNYQTMAQALKTGRTFPQVRLWGLIEDKLALALDKIWEDVLAEAQPDIDAIMSKHLDPLARQLGMTLKDVPKSKH